MKFLAVVTPPPGISHSCSTCKKFALVIMCGNRNFRKHRDIYNGEQYIFIDINSNIYFLENREVTSSESIGYMERLVKRLTNSLALRTKISNKKQKARFEITDINNQDFRKLLKKFNNSKDLCHKSKQVHNEETES